MISPSSFVSFLEHKNYRFFTGVPCSFFQHIINYLLDQPTIEYVIAPNEGSALAVASGAYLGGKSSVVMIQNSGLGNLINPLTSLNMIYDLPVLIFVSGRAYGVMDEPQHAIMGKRMPELLKSLGISFWDLPADEGKLAEALELGLREMQSTKKPIVFFVRKGTFSSYESKRQEFSPYAMKRLEAISIIKEALTDQDLVFATTGMPSRELFTVGDRKGNFYMQGSMGHIGSLAFGTAKVKPDRRIIVLDGDGAFLMHMGTVSMIGHYQPENLFHLVLDNEAYETTGNQDTTSKTTDFEAIAKSCGYRSVHHVQNAADLSKILPTFLKEKGPALLRIKINRQSSENIPRITSRYSTSQITESFLDAAQGNPFSKKLVAP